MEGANVHGQPVLLRAARGDQFISLRTRERIAERKRVELEATGWTVDVVECDEEDHVKLVPYIPPDVDWPNP